jgi:hypothetical protein
VKLSAAQRFDIWLTCFWIDQEQQARRGLHRWRWVVAFFIVAFSVADLVLTQTILTAVESLTGDQPSEANPIMAPIVMSWWAWPVRIGIPVLAVIRDVKRQNYSLMAFAFLLYGAVVAWNSYQFSLL